MRRRRLLSENGINLLLPFVLMVGPLVYSASRLKGLISGMTLCLIIIKIQVHGLSRDHQRTGPISRVALYVIFVGLISG